MTVFCIYCERGFINHQARRAHQRFCQAYKLSKGLPKDRHPDANPVFQPHVPSQRQRAEQVGACDCLRQILMVAVEHARLARLLDYKYGQEQGWRGLVFALSELHQRVWNTINRIEPSVAPTELYAEACWIQEQFLGYRTAHCPDNEVGAVVNDSASCNDYLQDEILLFKTLLAHAKELVSITPV